jgi:uncharacterized membrane protein
MDNFLLINLLFIFTGVVFIVLAIPLILAKIPPNQWYGFRTPKTLSEPHIWYAANRIMGYDLVAVGVAVCVSAISVLLTGRSITIGQASWINIGVLLSALFLAVIHSFLSLRNF